jgi:hypothetical protein
VTATPKAWDITQSLLWQCISSDPGCLRFVVDVLLVNRHKAHRALSIDLGSSAINALIHSSAPVGHGSEVLWCIWAAMVLKLAVSLSSQEAISQMDDALVAAASMIAKDRQVFSAEFESTLWSSWFVEDAFDQEHWLFVYEAMRQGWMTSEDQPSGAASVRTAGDLRWITGAEAAWRRASRITAPMIGTRHSIPIQ